ncbi:MAG: EAL domain-containing protein [Lachnospiraceae bacterium]|nr:EAL domain-containing protein [Lachnospiraceae bacterium]
MEKYRYPEAELALIENSVVPIGVYQYLDKHIITVALSKGFLRLFGYEDRESAYRMMDEDMFHGDHPDDIARITDAAVIFATEGGEYNTIYRSLIRDEYHIIHAFGRHVTPTNGVTLGVIWYVDEGPYVSDDSLHGETVSRNFSISLKDASLQRRSNYDSLTGLPNMTYFFELAITSRDKVIAEGGHCAIGYVDFNGMKYFNKKHGFAEGNNMLRGFASLLEGRFGNENCCHISQDTFCFFALTYNLEENLRILFEEVAEMVGERQITVRVGIYTDSIDLVDTSVACDRARYACNSIRDNHHSSYCFFDESMLATENQRQYILDNLDRALSEGWIRAYYHPIVRAANAMVCDEEALARWEDPVRGTLSPADFIPFLEDAGLIWRLDLYMVEQVLQRMKKQQAAGLYVVPISVNLSRTDFDACDIVEEIRRRVDDAGVAREMIPIEITESVLARDFDFMKEQIERFRELGFPVWMDDFGSGYSSLDLLQTIHFDLIKLDMRFMKQFDNGEKSRVIITELMKMAIGLGIETVSEGVEEHEQVDFLKEVGCTKLQGYFFTNPLPFDEIMRRHEQGVSLMLENPEEASYYEAIGRINLYDMALSATDTPESVTQYFNTFPMEVLESDDRTFRIIRCNKTYRDVMDSSGATGRIGATFSYADLQDAPDASVITAIRQCALSGERMFINERIGDHASVHALVRRIAVNPVTGLNACLVVVLGIKRDN